MLQETEMGTCKCSHILTITTKLANHLEILVHHDDGTKKYSYDKGVENVLQKAKDRNWDVVSMKNDFKDMFPAENKNKTALNQ